MLFSRIDAASGSVLQSVWHTVSRRPEASAQRPNSNHMLHELLGLLDMSTLGIAARLKLPIEGIGRPDGLDDVMWSNNRA